MDLKSFFNNTYEVVEPLHLGCCSVDIGIGVLLKVMPISKDGNLYVLDNFGVGHTVKPEQLLTSTRRVNETINN